MEFFFFFFTRFLFHNHWLEAYFNSQYLESKYWELKLNHWL